ncbi:MAG: aminotransferase class V-fold PLP-dependent enzyme [Planctomycetaceae bacterium]|nr:MAG: aminotransferase class V-fold PLP-dependent enzyme [Planctomycetaceae bacterium]
MKKRIYLDYAATTPVDPRVAAKMSQFLTDDGNFGNPASAHRHGVEARQAVEEHRGHVARLIGATPEEIIWTSGATEADNLALKGAAYANAGKGRHIVTIRTEHKAILDTCRHLEEHGFEVTYVRPLSSGLIDLDELSHAIRPDTVLVSIMHVNNELGALQDIAAIGRMTRARGVLFHVDAAQSAGKVPIDVRKMAVDLMSLSAHKVYGPMGIGALYVGRNPRVRIAAQIHGGGHERNMRSGTLPTSKTPT